MSDVRLNVPPRLIESARAAQYANRESLGSRELEERIKKRTKIKAVQERKKNPLAQQEREGGQLEFERKENYKIWTRRRRPTGNGWLLAPTEGYTGDFIPVEAGGDFEQSTFATSDHKFSKPLLVGIAPAEVGFGFGVFLEEHQFKFELVNNMLLGSNVINVEPYYGVLSGSYLDQYPGSGIDGYSIETSASGSICHSILAYIYDKDSRIVALSEKNDLYQGLYRGPEQKIDYVKANGESVSEINPVLDAGSNGLKEWTLEIILEVPAVPPFLYESSRDPVFFEKDNTTTYESYYSEFNLYGFDTTGYRRSLFEVSYYRELGGYDFGRKVIFAGWYMFGRLTTNSVLTETSGTFHVVLQGKDNQTSLFVNGQKLNTIRFPVLTYLVSGIAIYSHAYQAKTYSEEKWVQRLLISESNNAILSPAPSYSIGFHSLRFTPLAIYNEDGFEPPSRITSLYDT